MEDLRYPIGPFRTRKRELTEDERTSLIDAIEAHPARMRAAVAGLSDAQLDTPYREDGWTSRQVVHHVVDSHMNAYIRFKLAVTQDHPTVGTYDEKLWAELPDARTGPPETSLDILEALHRRWVAFLRALEAAHFRRSAHHPEYGDITVDLLLEIYGWHCPHHEGHVTGLRARKGW